MISKTTTLNRRRLATSVILVAFAITIPLLAATPMAAAAVCKVSVGPIYAECSSPRGMCAAAGASNPNGSAAGCMAADY